MNATAGTAVKRRRKLHGLSDVRRYFHRNEIPVYFISATNFNLLESGTITDPNLDLYYPSIAANPSGVVVIACNGSSTNTFISSYAYVGSTVSGVTMFNNKLLLNMVTPETVEPT